MKLKVRQSASTVTEVLRFDPQEQPLLAGWEITVRAMTAARERGLIDRASRNGKVDSDRLHELYAEECFAGWAGLTPAMVGGLVELADDAELPAADAGGEIPFSVELAAFLLREARAELVQIPVLRMSRRLLEAVALEKKSGFVEKSAA